MQEGRGRGEEGLKKEIMKTGPKDGHIHQPEDVFAADGNPLRNQQQGGRR